MSLKIRNETGKALDIWICIGDRKALGHIPEEKVTVKLNVPSGADALEYRYSGGESVRRIQFKEPLEGEKEESYVIGQDGNIKGGDGQVQKHIVKDHTPQGVTVLKVTNHSDEICDIVIVYPHGKSKGKVNGRSRMSMRCTFTVKVLFYIIYT
jgi:hypothetical protein